MNRMNGKHWLLLSLALVAAALSTACSSKFSSCESRRACPAGGKGGAANAGTEDASAGDAGSEDESNQGGNVGKGGKAGHGDDAQEGGSAGERETSQSPVLFEACSVKGEFACVGHGSAQRLACDGKLWQAGTTCAASELCDSMSGQCRKAVPECAEASFGAVVCRNDQLLTCGLDLITASVGETCTGTCEDGACQKPICGDQKVEPGEECDAGKDGSASCGRDCKAVCGDGTVLTGYEQCDDRNIVSGDGCSADCNWEPIALSLGDMGTCALSGGGAVKCWGQNAFGQLGLGDVKSRGDDKGEIAELPVIALGTGRTAKAISSGSSTNCALLDNGRVKCWGLNSDGQLGLGDTINRGGLPGQMGDALPAVALIGNARATSVSSGNLHVCVVANDLVQCWGSGASGQLGQGDYAMHSLPVSIYDFGKVSSVSASAGGTFNCQLLQIGKIICWGDNSGGQLSYANDRESVCVGDRAGEMSELFPVAFESTARAIAPGLASVCAILSDDSVRCWGKGDFGQLGSEDSEPQGTIPYTIGSVEPVALGTNRKPKAITAGARHVCVLLDDGNIKCWGDNSYGQLGIGSIVTVGREPGTMGDNLKAVMLGAGRSARQVVAGENHTCALLDNGAIKCWGRNFEGALGLGDIVNHGAGPNQMGDDLPAVPLNF